MKKFLKKLVLFFLPLLLLLGVPILLLYKSKENFLDIDKVIQSNNKVLIGYAHNEDNYKYLKWKTIDIKERFSIWALGSSRILQLRENMFVESFYNAGYTITGIKEFKQFLEISNPTKYPKYLIVNLDQWMFNENYDNLADNTEKRKWTEYKKYPNLTTIKATWIDLFSKKYNFFNIMGDQNSNKIGLNAKLNNLGFRNDGSMLYGNQIQKLLINDSTANDYKFENTLERIKEGATRFKFGNQFNKNTLGHVESLLKFCKKNNIKVIAFLPPFSSKVFERMNSSGNYKYMNEIYSNLSPIFKKFNFDLFDFTHMDNHFASDKGFIDGFHGSEQTYLKILLKMAQSSDICNMIVDRQNLLTDSINSVNRYQVYN